MTCISTCLLRLPLAVVGAMLVLLLSFVTASAHEHREVGEYEMIVGFRNEPALVNEPNGLDLRIQRGVGETGTPVEGLAETLQAEIIYGDQTMPLELRPRFGQPGAYTADVIPTQTGAYTFHIFGSIDGMAIDESFTSGPETFSEVEAKEPISFPANIETAEMAAIVDAEDTAASARTLAIIGIVAGIAGLIAGAVGVIMAMNARSARPAEAVVVPHEADHRQAG